MTLEKITVVLDKDEEGGFEEERFTGYLVDGKHCFYRDKNMLWLVAVERSEDGLYRPDPAHLLFADVADDDSVIEPLVRKLFEISGWDLLIKHIGFVSFDDDFRFNKLVAEVM